jgi:hypothetical protein
MQKKKITATFREYKISFEIIHCHFHKEITLKTEKKHTSTGKKVSGLIIPDFLLGFVF